MSDASNIKRCQWPVSGYNNFNWQLKWIKFTKSLHVCTKHLFVFI